MGKPSGRNFTAGRKKKVRAAGETKQGNIAPSLDQELASNVFDHFGGIGPADDEITSDEQRVISLLAYMIKLLIPRVPTKAGEWTLEGRLAMEALNMMVAIMNGTNHPIHNYMKGIRSYTGPNRPSASLLNSMAKINCAVNIRVTAKCN